MARLGQRLAAAALLAMLGANAGAQTPQVSELENGAAFQCQDGSRLLLRFEPGDGLSALIQVLGKTYRLPYQPPAPGPTQIVWSDGDHSLTWSPGVQLMWMGDGAHLMCGRGGHHH